MYIPLVISSGLWSPFLIFFSWDILFCDLVYGLQCEKWNYPVKHIVVGRFGTVGGGGSVTIDSNATPLKGYVLMFV